VAPRDGHWVIKDFHYPDGDNLVADLRQNQKDRDRTKPNRRVRHADFLDGE